MTMTAADAGVDHVVHHDDATLKSHTKFMTALALIWVAVWGGAAYAFGLGGLITAATISTWIYMAVLVVMTAGG